MARIRKLKWKQLGSYRITGIKLLLNNYKLQKLDNTILKDVYIGNRLKKFHIRLEEKNQLSTIQNLIERLIPNENKEESINKGFKIRLAL